MRVQLLAAFCVLVFSTGLMSDVVIYMNYLANQAEITELFCINKDVPEMKCDGKCHLKSQLEKQSGHEPAPPSEVKFERLHFVAVDFNGCSILLNSDKKPNLKRDFTPSILNGHSKVDLPPPRLT